MTWANVPVKINFFDYSRNRVNKIYSPEYLTFVIWTG